MTNKKNKRSVFSLIMALTMMIVMVFPASVFAEGEEPPTEEAPPTEEIEVPPAEEVPPQETPESQLPDPQVTVEPVNEEAVESPAPKEDLSEIVEVLAESDVVLVDGEGESLCMASEDTAEALAVSDPFYFDTALSAWVGYSDTGVCANRVNLANCHNTTTPVQDAVDGAILAGATNIFIVTGTSMVFNEDLTLNASTSGFTLMAIKNAWDAEGGVATGLATLNSISLSSNVSLLNIYAPIIYVNPGASIQDGISYVQDNGTVNVAAGTFTEQLTIEKDITLQGSGPDQTTILSPDNLADKSINSAARKPIIYVNNADVEIKDLTVDSRNINAAYGTKMYGIALNNAGGQIENVDIYSYRSGPNYLWASIYQNLNTGSDRNLNILDSGIFNFGRSAIDIRTYLPTSSFLIDNNQIFGDGLDGSLAQSPISVQKNGNSPSLTGTISNNYIADVIDDGYYAQAISLGFANDVTVANNTFSNVSSGIYSLGSSVTITDNSIPVTPSGAMPFGIYLTNGRNYDAAAVINVDIQNNDIYLTDSSLSGYGLFASGKMSTDNDVLNISMLNNSISNFYTGLWLQNGYGNGEISTFVAHDNKITNNSYGFVNYISTLILDAIYNYWGCDEGPNASTCGWTWGNGVYDPWLIDPDGDEVFEASDSNPVYTDNCPDAYNPNQTDTDGDGFGDACDATPNGDDDLDGVDNLTDNCPAVSNADQKDTDDDGLGNVCDPTPNGDNDSDGVDNLADNCPNASNPGQLDSDNDGIGDACDPTPEGPGQAGLTAGAGPRARFGQLIPVTGSEQMELTCDSECVAFELPDGSVVEFCGLCGYSVSLSVESDGTIPFDMPDGVQMMTGFTLNLFDKDGNLTTELPDGATVNVSYPLGGKDASTMGVQVWDPIKEEWLSLVDLTSDGDYLQAPIGWPGTILLVE